MDISLQEPLINKHEEKVDLIKDRAAELLKLEIERLINDINLLIDNGTIDEGLANAISKNKENYYIIKRPYNENINYTLVLSDVIKKLKLLYEPTYRICVYPSDSNYIIYIKITNSCSII